MTLVWRPGFQFDADASTYIEAVEAADTQALETGVRYAINDFVIGCKNDGIWDAIKASCILAGARTLNGALVPLVGTAPTNYNFVSGDYDRETGLVGDGSTKYLDSNRNNNIDPQNSQHLAVSVSTVSTGTGTALIGTGAELGRSTIFRGGLGVNGGARRLIETPSSFPGTSPTSTGLYGVNRSAASSFLYRIGGVNGSVTLTSETPSALPIYLFALNPLSNYSNARLAFYSIGESLDLAALDTRVSDLITAIGAAIP